MCPGIVQIVKTDYLKWDYTADLKFLLVTQYVLIFLPLVYMIGYVIWSLILIPRFGARVREWLAKISHNNNYSYSVLLCNCDDIKQGSTM